MPTRGLLAASKTLETSPMRPGEDSARRTCRATAERRINAIYIYTLPEQKMTSFASALVACIGVIAAGYGAGRLKIIDTTGAGPAAIGAFVGRFALPALLFRELATLHWKDIDGRLLASVAAAKALLFAGVLGCSTLLESRRAGDDRCTN